MVDISVEYLNLWCFEEMEKVSDLEVLNPIEMEELSELKVLNPIEMEELSELKVLNPIELELDLVQFVLKEEPKPLDKVEKCATRRHSVDYTFSPKNPTLPNGKTTRSRQRGRPQKELLKVLPTIEDYPNLPTETAKNLIHRIKRCELSRNHRIKKKEEMASLNRDLKRLEKRDAFLQIKLAKVNQDVEKYRKWLK